MSRLARYNAMNTRQDATGAQLARSTTTAGSDGVLYSYSNCM